MTRTKPITVILRLAAKDRETTINALRGTYEGTMAADGVRSYEIRVDQDKTKEIVLIQSWDSRAQQEAYIAWREERGDLANLVSGLTRAPEVAFLEEIRT